jgi:hypothetical protein
MGDEKSSAIMLTTLVDPFLTEKTRRIVARAFGIQPLKGSERDRFLATLTVVELQKKLPTFEMFKDRAREHGFVLDKTLDKVRPLYEELD